MGDTTSDPADRLLTFFESQHLPPGPLQDVSRECGDLAMKLAAYLPASPERTVGLRKLLEAKDCFVRAALERQHADERAAIAVAFTEIGRPYTAPEGDN